VPRSTSSKGRKGALKFNKDSEVAERGDHLTTIDMGRKVGAAVPLFRRGSWVFI